MKKKGNALIYIILLVGVSTILISSTLNYIGNINNITKLYSDSVKKNYTTETIKNKVISYIENNEILIDNKNTIDNINIEINPIVVNQAIDTEKNDIPVVSKHEVNRYEEALSNKLFFKEPGYYFIYGNKDEFTLKDLDSNTIGKSENNGSLLDLSSLTSEYDCYFVTNSDFIYTFHLDEWDRTKFNGIYKVTIHGDKPITMLVHKYDNIAKELIIFN